MSTICSSCSKKLGFLDSKIESEGQIICGTCYDKINGNFEEDMDTVVNNNISSDNYPVESLLLIIAGWVGVIVSLFIWIILINEPYSSAIYAAIIGISGVLGSLMMIGFARIISLLVDIKNNQLKNDLL